VLPEDWRTAICYCCCCQLKSAQINSQHQKVYDEKKHVDVFITLAELNINAHLSKLYGIHVESEKGFLLENFRGKNNLGDLHIDWRILLKNILQRQGLKLI
jgi:hypothetical protein